MVALRQVLAHQWDEGHRQRSTGDQREEQIGQVVGDVEGIQFGGKTELASDDDRAPKGQDFIQQEEEAE